MSEAWAAGPGLEDEVVEDQADHDEVDQDTKEDDDVCGCDLAQFHGSGRYGTAPETSM